MSIRTETAMKSLSLGLAMIFLVCAAFFIHILAPVSFVEKWKEVEIPEGSSFSEGTDILVSNGIIENSFAFLLLGRITSNERQLKPGYYNLSASLSPMEVFDHLIDGRTIQYTVTIPEGSDLKKIRKRFRKTGLFNDESWKLVEDREFLDLLNIEAPSLEGYLFPDTYNFAKGTDPKVVFKIMVQRMRERFNQSLMKRAESMGMTVNETLTLASIIEKEAVVDSERAIISAVYHNRLKKKMKLQADPTVLYGIKKRWIRIRYRDLKRRTPYNTYVIKGLPPGPIASPGLKSIEAALYPADVDYLFFVAKNDGTHFFSSNNEDHWRAVVHYQRNGREKKTNGKKKKN